MPSTATSDCPALAQWPATSKTDSWESFRFVLSRELPQSFLGFFYIFEGEFAGLDQVRHDGLRAPAKQRQQVVDQPTLRHITGDRSLKNVEVANLLDAPHGFLPFQTIDGGLNRCVGRPAFFGERFLNLADRGIAAGPQRLHDLQLKLRQFGFAHVAPYYLRVSSYYHNSRGATVFHVSFRSRNWRTRTVPPC